MSYKTEKRLPRGPGWTCYKALQYSSDRKIMKLHHTLYFPKIKSMCLPSRVTLKWNGSTVQASPHLSKNGSIHTDSTYPSKPSSFRPLPLGSETAVRLPWQSEREPMWSFATMGKKWIFHSTRGKKKRKIPLKWAILGVFSAPSSLASILRLVAQAKCYQGWGGPGSPGSKAQLCSRLWSESLTVLVWSPSPGLMSHASLRSLLQGWVSGTCLSSSERSGTPESAYLSVCLLPNHKRLWAPLRKKLCKCCS